MLEQKTDLATGVSWLEFSLFKNYPEVVHASFLRHGGVSASPFHSLNVSYEVGDRGDAVFENRQRIKKILQVPNLAEGQQTHSAHIALIGKEGAAQRADLLFPNCDALITDQTGIALMIKHADCQAALFYCPHKKIIAAAHAGWRGSVLNIYAAVIRRLKKMGCSADNLLVALSPSLGPQAAEFVHYKKELPPSFWQHRQGDCHFDFWAISCRQLQKEGVLPQHIQVAGLCTVEKGADFFSYRKEKLTGRQATLIALKER
jgi:hypothetical protein